MTLQPQLQPKWDAAIKAIDGLILLDLRTSVEPATLKNEIPNEGIHITYNNYNLTKNSLRIDFSLIYDRKDVVSILQGALRKLGCKTIRTI